MVELEEGGLVWDETVRVVVEGGGAMEVEEEDVEEEAEGSGWKIVLESRDGVVV